MKIFLSYASEDRPQAEEIQLALAGAGHEVFFDRESLPAGGDYHARIKASVDDAELFVFLISPDSVAGGGYALTEMGYARSALAASQGACAAGAGPAHALPDDSGLPEIGDGARAERQCRGRSGGSRGRAGRMPERYCDTAGMRKYALIGAAGVVLLAGRPLCR